MKQSEIKKYLKSAIGSKQASICMLKTESDNPTVKPMIDRDRGYLAACNDFLDLMNDNAVNIKIESR